MANSTSFSFKNYSKFAKSSRNFLSQQEVSNYFFVYSTFDFILLFYPRANGAKHHCDRKRGARVTNSARLFTPGKMRTHRSVKSINNRVRVTMFQGWTSHLSQKYGGPSRVERANIERLHNTKESFFNLPLKE